MKHYWKLILLSSFVWINWIYPCLFACPIRDNKPSFDIEYLTADEIVFHKIKSQYAYKIIQGDTIKSTEIQFNKKGEPTYVYYLKYNRYPVEQYTTYDTVNHILTSSVYDNKILDKSKRVKTLNSGWEYLEIYYPNSPSFNDSIYLLDIEEYDSLHSERIYFRKIVHSSKSILEDTLIHISNKDRYNAQGLIIYNESYYEKDTTKTYYTYNKNQQLTRTEDNYGDITTYDYKDGKKHCKTEYINFTEIHSKTYYNGYEKPEHIYFYNDTNALDAEQIIHYDMNQLVTQVLSYGYLDQRTIFMKDTTHYDIIGNDTLFALIDSDTTLLNYNLPPDTLLFTYEYY